MFQTLQLWSLIYTRRIHSLISIPKRSYRQIIPCNAQIFGKLNKAPHREEFFLHLGDYKIEALSPDQANITSLKQLQVPHGLVLPVKIIIKLYYIFLLCYRYLLLELFGCFVFYKRKQRNVIQNQQRLRLLIVVIHFPLIEHV